MSYSELLPGLKKKVEPSTVVTGASTNCKELPKPGTSFHIYFSAARNQCRQAPWNYLYSAYLKTVFDGKNG